jgi:UDPglucose 6-dehydrogenase
MQVPLIIVNKSTVPVGTGDWVADIVRKAQPMPIPFSVVSCPEFLREGSAIVDFMQPHRTVLGSMDREGAEKVAQLHLPLRAPIVITDLRTAEMIKCPNAFLTKIIINELQHLRGLRADNNIIGWAMTNALAHSSWMPVWVMGVHSPKTSGVARPQKGPPPQLLNAVMNNDDRRPMVIDRLGGYWDLQGKRRPARPVIRPNTDDISMPLRLISLRPVRSRFQRALTRSDGYLMILIPWRKTATLVVVTEWNGQEPGFGSCSRPDAAAYHLRWTQHL